MPDALRAQKEAGNDEIVPVGLVLYWLEQVKSSVAVIFVLHRPIVFTVDPEDIKVLLIGMSEPQKIAYKKSAHI